MLGLAQTAVTRLGITGLVSMIGRIRPRVATCLVAGVLLVVACNPDEPTAPTLSPASIARKNLDPSDPDLNYNDTWESATETIADTLVVTSDEAVTDPVTGAQVTTLVFAEDPQSVLLLAGYGGDGQLRVTTTYPTLGPLDGALVRQVDDATADLDNNGYADATALVQEPTAELGSLVDAQIDPTGGGGISCASYDSSCQLQMNLIAGDQSRSTQSADSMETVQIDASHRRTTQFFSMPSGAGLAAASSETSSEGNTEVRQVRDFSRENNLWILRHIRTEAVVKGGGNTNRHVQDLEISNLRYNINHVEDAKRKERRERGDIRTTSKNPTWLFPAPTSARRFVACEYECGGGVGSDPFSGYPYEQRVDEDAQVASDQGLFDSGNLSVVFQHGFASGSDTWRPMMDWLHQDLIFASLYRWSLPWRQTYETESDSLYHLSLSVGNPMVIVGHSNGGMVGRYLARNKGFLDLRGVVTVGTPNKGTPLAPLAKDMSRLLGWLGWPAKVFCPFAGLAGCARFGDLANSPVSHVMGHLAEDTPVAAEMHANDSYHDQFNAQPEPFQRYGVESYVWIHWLEWGVNGDMKCFPWEASCSGHAEVKTTDRVYHHDISCSIVGVIVLNWSKAVRCALDAAFLKGVDILMIRYSQVTDMQSDAIVPKYSQLYPNIPSIDQFEIPDGPYHWGETKSREVMQRLETIFINRFGVPPRTTY